MTCFDLPSEPTGTIGLLYVTLTSFRASELQNGEKVLPMVMSNQDTGKSNGFSRPHRIGSGRNDLIPKKKVELKKQRKGEYAQTKNSG